MADSVFYNANNLKDKEVDDLKKVVLEYNTIEFEILGGVNSIRLIERLRLLEIVNDDKLDIDAKFDFSYDITMQMLEKKEVVIYWNTEKKKVKVYSFFVNSRYMDLRSIPLFDLYPCIFEWLVHFVVGGELKKYPLSLENIQGIAREK